MEVTAAPSLTGFLLEELDLLGEVLYEAVGLGGSLLQPHQGIVARHLQQGAG